MTKRLVIPVQELVYGAPGSGALVYENRTLIVWEGKGQVMYTMEGKAERTWNTIGVGQMKLLPREKLTQYGYTISPPSADKEAISITTFGGLPVIAPVGTFDKILATFYDYEDQDLLSMV